MLIALGPRACACGGLTSRVQQAQALGTGEERTRRRHPSTLSSHSRAPASLRSPLLRLVDYSSMPIPIYPFHVREVSGRVGCICNESLTTGTYVRPQTRHQFRVANMRCGFCSRFRSENLKHPLQHVGIGYLFYTCSCVHNTHRGNAANSRVARAREAFIAYCCTAVTRAGTTNAFIPKVLVLNSKSRLKTEDTYEKRRRDGTL